MADAVGNIVPLTAGVLSHLGYFRRGEHHLYSTIYIQGFICVFAASISFFVFGQDKKSEDAVFETAWLAFYYLAGLYSSLVVYRVFFHPLRRFPGPFGSRISIFSLSIQLRNADGFRQMEKLHQRYGPFVRVGSSDLSIAHPKAVPAVYGMGSKCTKASWYDLSKPMVSLQTLRERHLHDQRRRTWSAAFGDKALRGYEKRIRVYLNKFMEQLTAFDGKPVNVTKWFNLYSFDVMGDLVFGKSFDMLETSQEHWAIKLLNDGLEPLAFLFPVWFFRTLTAIPGLTRDWWRFIALCEERMEQRMKTKVEIPDIASALLAPLEGRKPHAKDLDLLRGDSQLVIIAGSDTTASTLSGILFELGKHPEHIAKLREELAPYYTDASGEILHEKIANLQHLNGVINEALRLHPPVATAVQRLTPPEGIEIDGTYIPGNTTVWCPQYVLGRSEEVYQHSKEFTPERWYLYPNMVKEKSAFAPFSAGQSHCIGKPLALLNIRTTLAKLIANFDFGFAPGEYGKNFEGKARDHFTVNFGELNISFKKRAN